MIQIDTGVTITALVAIITLAAWMGALSQKVRGHGRAIETNRTDAEHDFERLHTENREDHQKLYDKLDDIQHDLKNGRINHGS